MEVWQTSNLRRLRLGEEKKKEEETTRQKYNGLPYSYSGESGGYVNLSVVSIPNMVKFAVSRPARAMQCTDQCEFRTEEHNTV